MISQTANTVSRTFHQRPLRSPAGCAVMSDTAADVAACVAVAFAGADADTDTLMGGGGHMMAPSFVTVTPRTTSSSSSRTSTPFFPGVHSFKKFTIFWPYSWDACPGRRAERSRYPMMVTPFSLVTTLSGCESAQLPPSGLAPMSTMTEPGFMPATASSVRSSGAGLPGTCAVVMTISLFAACFAYTASVCFCCSASSSCAYPSALFCCTGIATNAPPKDST